MGKDGRVGRRKEVAKLYGERGRGNGRGVLLRRGGRKGVYL